MKQIEILTDILTAPRRDLIISLNETHLVII